MKKLTIRIINYEKLLVILILTAFMTSCQRNDDPFSDIELGFVNKKNFQFQLVKQGLISDPENDSTVFRYNLVNDKKKFPVEISFNSGRYKFGKLRDININLNGDTIYWDKDYSFARASGSRLKSDVDNIYDIYCHWYGQPDSIYIEYPKLIDNPVLALFANKEEKRKVDSSKIPKKKAFWYKKNFTLSFHLPIPEKEPQLDSALAYYSANINYRVIDYANQIKRIKDSIRKALNPRDLVSMNMYNPVWASINTHPYYDSKFEVKIDEIKRKDFEEDRGVSEIRFDIVLSDSFDKELFKIKDATYEPPKPLINGSSGIITFNTFPVTFTSKYNKKSKEAIEFERTRKYAENNKIKVYADIKAVVFTDGSVLKSN